jgi:WD40-like Beta Propeller Repeat
MAQRTRLVRSLVTMVVAMVVILIAMTPATFSESASAAKASRAKGSKKAKAIPKKNTPAPTASSSTPGTVVSATVVPTSATASFKVIQNINECRRYVRIVDVNVGNRPSYKVFILDSESAALPALDGGYYGFKAMWSPDCAVLAIFSGSYNSPITVSFVRASDGKMFSPFESRSTINAQSIVWSPDSKSVAVVCAYGAIASPGRNIFITPSFVDVDTKTASSLVRLISMKETDLDVDPKWAPDSERIAYTSNRSGNNDIWVVNVTKVSAFAKENELQNVTNNPADDNLPMWSTNGATISFTSDRGGSKAQWAVNADGNGEATRQ